VKLLVQEVKHKLKVKVIDIPVIGKGSNNHVRCIVLHPLAPQVTLGSRSGCSSLLRVYNGLSELTMARDLI
jgi:hypothetical protein